MQEVKNQEEDNYIFSKLVSSKSDVAGMVAYSLYKFEKVNHIKIFEETELKKISEESLINFQKHCIKEIPRYQLESKKELYNAINDLVSKKNDELSSQETKIKRKETELKAKENELKSEKDKIEKRKNNCSGMKNFHSSFFGNLWTNTLTSIIITVISLFIINLAKSKIGLFIKDIIEIVNKTN